MLACAGVRLVIRLTSKQGAASFFEPGTAELRPCGEAALAEVAACLRGAGPWLVEVHLWELFKSLAFVIVKSRKVAEAMISFVVDGYKRAQAHLLLVRGSQQASGKERRHRGAVERGQLQP